MHSEISNGAVTAPRLQFPGVNARRRWLALGVAACALLLGGCVYLRLLEIKKQLGHFDENFSLQSADGLGLICHTPVLLTSDLRWIGVMPESVKKLGTAEQWRVRWIKQLPPGVTEKLQFDLMLEFSFVDGKLSRATIPEQYFAVMPKPFLVTVIKSLGHGHINKGSKEIDSALSGPELAAARPSLPSIDKLLGRPSEEYVEGPNTITRYQYVPATKESGAKTFDMRLTFDTQTGELLKWQGFTPVGKIAFDFTADRKK